MFNVGYQSDNNTVINTVVNPEDLDSEPVSDSMSHVTARQGTRGSNYDYHRRNRTMSTVNAGKAVPKLINWF